MERFSSKKTMGLYLQWILLLFILMIGSGCSQSKPLALKPGENIRVKLYVENAGRFHVGDSIPLILTIEARKGVSFQIPELDESSSGGLELKTKELSKPETFSEGIRQKTLYLMSGWHVGQYKIPALNLPYETSSHQQGKIKTNPVTVRLSSVLPKGISEAELLTFNIKGIQSPLGLEPRYFLLKWFILGAFILCCLALLFYYFYRRSLLQSQDASEAIQEAAHIIALRRLASIRTMEISDGTDFKTLYSELSECMREYMENRYSIRALEMTTEEFLKQLTTGSYLNTEQQSLLKDFLVQSDLVKFANHSPSKEEAERALLHIEQLVETTKEQPVESIEPAVPVQTTL
jgi:hypothetical protein